MEEDIAKGNEIIREFMGWPTNKIEIHFLGGTMRKLQYHFHMDWNLLMAACKKFDNLSNRTKDYQRYCDEIDAAVTNYEILPAWKRLLRGIKWYNEVLEFGRTKKKRKQSIPHLGE